MKKLAIAGATLMLVSCNQHLQAELNRNDDAQCGAKPVMQAYYHCRERFRLLTKPNQDASLPGLLRLDVQHCSGAWRAGVPPLSGLGTSASLRSVQRSVKVAGAPPQAAR